MQFPQRFSDLPEYAFPRLRRLLDGHAPGGPVVSMSIGEPQHPVPDFVAEILARSVADFNRYPPNEGTPDLRQSIAAWLLRRYGVTLDPDSQIVSLNGTREGLFNAAIALCPERKNARQPVVLIPNPFYQCYMAAALAVGAEPVLVPATASSGFLPDFHAVPPDLLQRTALVYACSPANPQGAVATPAYWSGLIGLAEKHDFRILADECYSEIYRHNPPPGILAAVGSSDPERVLSFHSLSKRSNLAGLRSGFAAGGPRTISALARLRAYSGAPVPLPLQHVSAAAWADETHVEANRALYRHKFDLADHILGNLPGYMAPEAGFFLWLEVGDGEKAALRLWQTTGTRVLPGSYLSRPNSAAFGGDDPGARFIRAALVASPGEVERGLSAIRSVLVEKV